MGRLLDEEDVIAEIEHHKQFVMEKHKQKYGDTDGMTDLYFLAHDHIKEAIKAKVPSAQPDEKRTEEHTKTHSCDLISRQAAIDALADYIHNVDKVYSTGKLSAEDCRDAAKSVLDDLPSAQPETCEGCKHLGKWENEVEYGYPSPCTRCKRRVEDHYER